MSFLFVFACRRIHRRHSWRCIYLMAISLCCKPRPLLISRGAAPPCPRFPLRQDRFSALHSPPRCITSWPLYIYYETLIVACSIYMSPSAPLSVRSAPNSQPLHQLSSRPERPELLPRAPFRRTTNCHPACPERSRRDRSGPIFSSASASAASSTVIPTGAARFSLPRRLMARRAA